MFTRFLPNSRWLAIGLALLFAAPLLMMLSGALRLPGAPPPVRFEWWPDAPSLLGAQFALSLVPLARGLLNSLLVTALAVPLTLVTAAMAGFALTQVSRRLQAGLLTFLLLVASIPLTATWIPRFVMFESLGFAGSYVPLIAPALAGGSPLFVLLFYAAMRRLPQDLVDSARLEGLGYLAVWWKVAMPQVRPTCFAVGMLAGTLYWGNFMEALLYLKAERQLTAPLMLHALDLLGATQWPVLLAGSVLVTLPVVIAYLALQNFFTGNTGENVWSVR